MQLTDLPKSFFSFGNHQPYSHSYRVVDIEHWSPEVDPYAEFLRARVPLQERITPFAPTQANPALQPTTQFLNLSSDYNDHVMGTVPYTDEYALYLFNFWQYIDFYASWHGVLTYDAPQRCLVVEDSLPLPSEYGMLNLPNPAYTNAAHKNGVKSLACLFIPRSAQPYEELLKRNEKGEFIIAQKLIQMKKYFGFDGYFINQETSVKPHHIPIYKQFCQTLTDANIYTQWYDTIDDEKGKLTYKPSLIPSHASFIQDQALGQVNNSIFINYNWNSADGWNNGDSSDQQYIQTTTETIATYDLNAYDNVFMGLEVGMGRFDGSHNSTRNTDIIFDLETHQPLTSLAALGCSFVYSGLNADLESDKPANHKLDTCQWMVAERERMWFSGVKIDPTNTDKQPHYSRADVGVPDASCWTGIARYITERSPINGTIFATSFNTGHGMQYFISGRVASPLKWANINLQDILPTWQWRMDTSGTRLQVDFDYGSLASKGDYFTYQSIGGYNGGSSLVISGLLDAPQFIHLYKTALDLTPTSKASLTYRKVSPTDTTQMYLGLIFEDNSDVIEYLPVSDSHLCSEEFITSELDLSIFENRKLAVLGLSFTPTESSISNYQINIGELKITDGKNVTPTMPSSFTVDALFPSLEAYVSWEIQPYTEVNNYYLYALLEDGQEVFIGGTYDDTYYIKHLSPDTISLKLTAVGVDGTESSAAQITIDPKHTLQEHMLPQIESAPAAYTGSYYINGEYLAFTTPSTKNWWHMYIYINDELQKPSTPYHDKPCDYRIRSHHELNDLDLPKDGDELKVILMDYSGNFSEPTYFTFHA